MKLSIPKLISFIFSIIFLIIFFFLSYKYFVIYKNYWSIHILYLFVSFSLFAFWLIVFKSKSKIFRLLSVIYFISILIPVYSYEVWRNYPQLSYIFEEFDLRSRKQVLKHLINQKKEIVPTIPFLDTKSNLFPLSGISNKYTLFCNETGKYIYYTSDKHGFRNKNDNYLKKIDAILIGNSFAHGACVEEDISYHLNKKVNLINLGYQGNGPLKMYASLKEYGINLKPNYIIWMYSADNDLYDFRNENENETLKKYYNINFSQNLINKQSLIDKFLNKFFMEKFTTDTNRKFSHTIKLYNTRKSIENFFIKEKEKENFNEEFILFKKIFQNVINLSDELNAKIVFVFFSDIGGLNKNNLNVNDQNVIDYIKSKNISLINIYELMKKEDDYSKYFPFQGKRFGHYNGLGYKVVSDQIEKQINK